MFQGSTYLEHNEKKPVQFKIMMMIHEDDETKDKDLILKAKKKYKRKQSKVNDKNNNPRMDYVMNFFKGLFSWKTQHQSSSAQKRSNFGDSNDVPLNYGDIETGLINKDSKSSVSFPSNQPRTRKGRSFSIQFENNDARQFECYGLWEIVFLHKIPNDLRFIAIETPVFEKDDIVKAFERTKSSIKEEEEDDNWMDDLNHKSVYFREIPDGDTIHGLRHYLLTPGMRFFVISQSPEDIETFVHQSAFRHWILGLPPFQRQFEWPMIFKRLINKEHFPAYINDHEEANKILKGMDKTGLSSSDDETEHYHLKPSVFSNITFLLNPHEVHDSTGSNESHESPDSLTDSSM